ncbi:MAG: DHHA1 domain protein [Methanocella sp. PtaU1.Bin125]|nr:MAG: DHHA1 domain protein [Methanocella sp. PtaU1.Bin125]
MTTLILTHADTDGLCSGALARAVYGDARVMFSNPVSLPADIRYAGEYDRLVVCDIAFDLSLAGTVKKMLDEISGAKEIVYLDHHPLPRELSAPWLVHDTDSCGSLLTFDHFRRALDANMSRVAMYGAIGDYRDNAPLARGLVRRWDKRSLYYQAGTLSQGIEMARKDYDYKRLVLERLAKNELPSEIGDLSRQAVAASRLEEGLRDRVERTVERMQNIAYVINPEGFISKAAIYARIYGDRPVGICADYRKYRDVYDISVRSTPEVAMNELLNASAVRFGGYGGGHPMAGGGRIPADRLHQFLADFDRQIGRALAGKGQTAISVATG